MRAGLVAAALSLAAGGAACGGGSDGRPDARITEPDGDGGLLDGPVSDAGLIVRLTGEPPLPRSIGGDHDAVLQRARVEFHNLRVVGDAAPGDDRTTAAYVLLEWPGEIPGSEERVRGRVDVAFPAAPPGIYSRLHLQVAAYRLRGTVVVGSETLAFDIDDEPPAPLSVSLDLDAVRLAENETRTIEVEADVEDAVLEVRWDEVVPDAAGVLRIGPDSPQIGKIREALHDEIEIEDDDD